MCVQRCGAVRLLCMSRGVVQCGYCVCSEVWCSEVTVYVQRCGAVRLLCMSRGVVQ